ncbi:MAG: serine hydrolase domain-containing protein [Deltaproteobacteria bacterium]|nr:serine hydrolase domain-containing protein [Deltaproteobacteria bacterium]
MTSSTTLFTGVLAASFLSASCGGTDHSSNVDDAAVIEDGGADGAVGASDGPSNDALSPADAGYDAPPSVGRCGAFDFSAARAVLIQAVASKKINGAGLAVLRKGCPPLLLESFGNQTNASVVELASASKAPSALAIMSLVERGTLSLDAKVGEVLTDAPADKAQISLRELLSHTSGLPGNATCLASDSLTLAACAKEILGARLQTPPAFVYGGASFQVAGRMAEVASGKPWNTLFSEALSAPCEAETLSFAASPRNNLGSDINPRIAGGAAASLVDYARFLSVFVNGGRCGDVRVLTSSTVTTILTNHIGALDQSGSPLSQAEGYGLGWWREKGGVIWSDPGAFGTYPWIDASHDYAAVLLIRKSLTVGHDLFVELQPRIEAALVR